MTGFTLRCRDAANPVKATARGKCADVLVTATHRAGHAVLPEGNTLLDGAAKPVACEGTLTIVCSGKTSVTAPFSTRSARGLAGRP